MMGKICFSLPLDLAEGQQGTLLLEECKESLKEVYAGHWCWAPRSGEQQKGGTPNHSPWGRAGEGGREETQLELGWSWETGMIHSITEEAEEEEGYLGLERGTAAEMKMGFHLWHFLWLRAAVSAYPTGRWRTEPLQQLPGQRRQPHSGQETGSARKAVQGPEGRAWHLWERAES